MTLKIYGNSGDWGGSFEDDGAHGGFTLKPCPFCGSTDLELANTHQPSYWVRCEECDAESGACRPKSTPERIKTKLQCETLHRRAQNLAVAHWNARS